MVTRRVVTEYLTMVGLPMLLLLGVIHLGGELRAPVSVNGDWVVSTNAVAETDGSCGPGLQAIDGATMSISQSGSYLEARLPGSAFSLLRGRSDGASLWLESRRSEGGDRIGELRLTGVVTQRGDEQWLRGAAFLQKTVDCPPVSFEARLLSDGPMQQERAEP